MFLIRRKIILVKCPNEKTSDEKDCKDSEKKKNVIQRRFVEKVFIAHGYEMLLRTCFR